MTTAKMTPDRLAKFVAALQQGGTQVQIAEASGMGHTTVGAYLRAFRRAGLSYVKGWLPDSRDTDKTPIHQLGRGDDVPRRRKSAYQVNKAYLRRRAAKERAQQAPVIKTTWRGPTPWTLPNSQGGGQ